MCRRASSRRSCGARPGRSVSRSPATPATSDASSPARSAVPTTPTSGCSGTCSPAVPSRTSASPRARAYAGTVRGTPRGARAPARGMSPRRRTRAPPAHPRARAPAPTTAPAAGRPPGPAPIAGPAPDPATAAAPGPGSGAARRAAARASAGGAPSLASLPLPAYARPRTPEAPDSPAGPTAVGPAHRHEESDVHRRAFMTIGSATVAAVSLELGSAWAVAPGDGAGPRGAGAPGVARGGAPGGARAARVPRRAPIPPLPRVPRPQGRVGTAEAAALEEAVRHIRLLDDRHGGDGIYREATQPLIAAYELLDAGAERRSVSDRLHQAAGELAISVGWLAHDSGRIALARSHYAEALATARLAGDRALEAHAFCNMAFLARDARRPREAVRAAQAAERAARSLASPRLLSLLALREAGGRAGLADQAGCVRALLRAQRLFDRGPSDDDPEWMSFFGEAEAAGLEAQCWSALREWDRAVEHARRSVALQGPHFVRNRALFTAELATDLLGGRVPDEAAAAGERVLALSDQVRSARVRAMVDELAQGLRPWRREPGVARFLSRHRAIPPA
ncbi:hypothetical protein OYE22_22525 [Streptomyces sp. 71268]|uniref:hypothetical protein n=1 Tax=Streptomyces sp. 71268 TaxID=3002640 RepID=UPI0023F7523A|nr:hypothetical protein [Streptomyces sp. 71268]WEV29921.1 hypothetical protein OYE22_22525 [Streptomyces sp. 71268]